ATLPGSDLDPEVRKFIRSVNRAMAELPAVAGAPHVQRRVRAETVRARWATGGPEMAASSDQTVSTTAGAVRLRIHKPGNGLAPALVYLHGGGWTMFSVDTHDRLMREYAARVGCAVVGIDYALSPEALYPTALTQVVDVLCWLHRHGHDLGIDASRLAIGGDSAGANLAVASCLALRDSKNAGLPLAMILSYGAFSTACSSDACRRYGGPDYMLSCEEMSGFWRDYLRNEADAQDPLACPLLARLDGLPAVFLGIAECDILAEQNLQMAARLQAAGVPVVSRIYRGASHSFLEAVSVARVSDRALTDAATWLGRVLDTR
ncbi:MAG: alpha/beta hydrolase fold domain-containing protein, partial [Woeseiaceae bacterium]